MKKILHIVLTSLVAASSGWSQNGHFTQFYNSGTYFNPAKAGAENNIRAIGNYRKQWTSVATGYTTQSFSMDAAGNYFSYGGYLSSNKAGAGSLTQTDALLTLAKHFKLNESNILSIGVQAGLTQYSFNPALLKFGNQYNSDNGYDPSLSNGESFNSNSYAILGNNFGISWKNTSSSWKPEFSFAVKNLINEQHAFTVAYPETSSRLYNLCVEVNKKISTKIELIPSVYYQRQNKANELVVGFRTGYCINETQKILAGAGIRNKDAVLTYIGIPLKNVLLGFSYDINTSPLKQATAGRGAWEISIIARFKRKAKIQTTTENIQPDEVLMHEKEKEKEVPAPIDSLDTSKQELPGAIKNTTEMVIPVEKTPENIIETKLLKNKTTNDENSKEAIINDEYSTKEMKKNNYLIYFDSDKSIIKPMYITLLNNLINEVKTSKSYRIVINGHTDIEGASAYNIELGEARADQVMTYFIEHGINIDMIKTCTYGKTSPIETGSDDHAKAKNRRVEIIVLTN